MSHIELTEGLPGIRGPMVFSPETTKPLGELVQVLLTGPHTLTPAEREMIATYVSSENDCYYCQTSHGSTAAQHLDGADSDYELISQIKHNYEAAPLSAKMKALLAIAGKVQKRRKARDHERRRRSPRAGRNRQGDPRYGPDRCRILYVQPLRGRPGNLGAYRSCHVSREWETAGRKRLCRSNGRFVGRRGPVGRTATLQIVQGRCRFARR